MAVYKELNSFDNKKPNIRLHDIIMGLNLIIKHTVIELGGENKYSRDKNWVGLHYPSHVSWLRLNNRAGLH